MPHPRSSWSQKKRDRRPASSPCRKLQCTNPLEHLEVAPLHACHTGQSIGRRGRATATTQSATTQSPPRPNQRTAGWMRAATPAAPRLMRASTSRFHAGPSEAADAPTADAHSASKCCRSPQPAGPAVPSQYHLDQLGPVGAGKLRYGWRSEVALCQLKPLQTRQALMLRGLRQQPGVSLTALPSGESDASLGHRTLSSAARLSAVLLTQFYPELLQQGRQGRHRSRAALGCSCAARRATNCRAPPAQAAFAVS